MIKINVTTAFTLYLGCVLALIFILAILHRFSQERKTKSIHSKCLIDCEFCHYTFLVELPQTVARCPQCHCLSKVKSCEAR